MKLYREVKASSGPKYQVQKVEVPHEVICYVEPIEITEEQINAEILLPLIKQFPNDNFSEVSIKITKAILSLIKGE